MKKSELYLGLGFVLIGLFCWFLAIVSEFVFESILWGWGGGALGIGLTYTIKYLYWNKPGRRAEYDRRLKLEKIEQHDERNIMLRAKSSRIAYMMMHGLYCVLMLAASFCVAMDWLMPFSRYAVFGLLILWLLQIIFGTVAYYWVLKRS